MSAQAHAHRARGEKVLVDDKFRPGLAEAPVVVIRDEPSPFGWHYLLEWQTGERAWVIAWAIHDRGWQPKTGDGCTCGAASQLSQYRIPQI